MKRIAILTAALTLALAGCGTGAETEPSPAVPAQSASGGPTTTAGGGGGSYTGDDLGTGTVFLGSDMFEGFRGSCTFPSTDPDQPSYAQPLQSEQILLAVGVVTEVAFSGTLDDGTPMLAALVCLLQ